MHHIFRRQQNAFCCLSLAVGVKIGIIIDVISLSLYITTYYTVATTGVELAFTN